MKLFKNLEDCKIILTTFLEELSLENQNRMKDAFLIAENYDEKGAIWLITHVFRDCLWDIDKALQMGFTSWLEKEIPNRRNAMIYHGMIK